MKSENTILLSGLDGSNPLAFLAALGTLRTLSLALPDDRISMAWRIADGAWRPELFWEQTTRCDLLTTLWDALRNTDTTRPELHVGKNLTMPPSAFRAAALNA